MQVNEYFYSIGSEFFYRMGGSVAWKDIGSVRDFVSSLLE